MKNKKVIIGIIIAVIIILIVAWYYLIYKPNTANFEGATCKVGILPGIIQNDICVTTPLVTQTGALNPNLPR